MKSESLTVVEEEERTGILCLMIAGAYSEFVSDAVAGAHELSALLVTDLICRFYLLCSSSSVDRF